MKVYMDESDEIIHALSSTVGELKKGIMDYSEKLKKVPQEHHQKFYADIKEMHNIAMKLNEGVDGLKRLKALKQRLSGNQ